MYALMNNLFKQLRVFAYVALTAVVAHPATAQDKRLPMPEPAGDREAFVAWQHEARGHLVDMLGVPETKVAIEPEARGQFEIDGVVVEKWVLTMEPGSKAPAVLYRPKDAPVDKLPAVVLTFGHGASKSHPSYQYIGQVLAKMNVICLAIDPIGEEERHKERHMGTRAHDATPVDEAAWNAGRPILGKLVFDTMRGVDFLLTRDDVDPLRIGVAGNSLGGCKAYWMAALDPRLRCAIASGAKTTDTGGKRCTKTPKEHMRQVLQWHEFLALAAPHCSVLFTNGDADLIIDRGDGASWRATDAAVAEAKRTFAALGNPGGLSTWYEKGGGHRPYPAHPDVLAWLVERLQPSGWTPKKTRRLPRVNFGEFAAANKVQFERLYGTPLHLKGATVAGIDIEYLRPDKLRVLKDKEIGSPEFTIEGWLDQVQQTKAPDSMDVLFVVVDDLNNWISVLDHDSPVKTPNLERLAKRGTLFTRAYCASPACNPSRVASLTGLRPTATGVYGNRSDWRKAVPNRKTIMQQFAAAGYSVRGGGKIFHHHLNGAFHDDASFEHFQHMRPQSYPTKKLNGAAEYGSRNTDWGEWPKRVEDSIDFHTASYCVEVLNDVDSDAKPLFLACGIYKPHSPFFAPASFHESYQDIELPLRKADDWSDLPDGAASLMKGTKWFWQGMESLEKQREGSYRNFIRSYAACVAFADAQIGRVLDALEKSPRRDNTIVVLWSDHGFHLGEKDHIEKFALWEKSNHIPFIVVAPGVTRPGSRCDRPVDMTALYPTLLELCGLPADAKCDGHSLMPLLRDSKAKWDRPAVMTYMRGNHAVRSDRWRYIRYADGSEELYDHDADPDEWHNLANEERYAGVIASHRKWLPTTEAKQVLDLKRR